MLISHGLSENMMSERGKTYCQHICIILITLLLVIFTTAGCLSLDTRRQNMTITKKMAVEVANKKAKELKYDIQRLDVDLDEQNSKWNNYLATSRIKDWQPELVAPLENKNYWAVYYGPRLFQYGGDLWVFVDKKSGEVITFIQGD